MPGEHRAARDRHGAEPGDDALGHVHRDRYRGPERGRGNGHDQDSGRDVVEVGAAAMGQARGPCEPGAELAAEDVDEEQQEDQRHPDEHDGDRRVPDLALEVAPQQWWDCR